MVCHLAASGPDAALMRPGKSGANRPTVSDQRHSVCVCVCVWVCVLWPRSGPWRGPDAVDTGELESSPVPGHRGQRWCFQRAPAQEWTCQYSIMSWIEGGLSTADPLDRETADGGERCRWCYCSQVHLNTHTHTHTLITRQVTEYTHHTHPHSPQHVLHDKLHNTHITHTHTLHNTYYTTSYTIHTSYRSGQINYIYNNHI